MPGHRSSRIGPDRDRDREKSTGAIIRVQPRQRWGGPPAGARAGTALLALVMALVLLSIGLAVVVPRADHEVRRRKEARLRFALGEFRRAARRFVERQGRPPADLGELSEGEQGRRFLRRVYSDPFTGKPDWDVSCSTNGLVVRSRSPGRGVVGP